MADGTPRQHKLKPTLRNPITWRPFGKGKSSSGTIEDPGAEERGPNERGASEDLKIASQFSKSRPDEGFEESPHNTRNTVSQDTVASKTTGGGGSGVVPRGKDAPRFDSGLQDTTTNGRGDYTLPAVTGTPPVSPSRRGTFSESDYHPQADKLRSFQNDVADDLQTDNTNNEHINNFGRINSAPSHTAQDPYANTTSSQRKAIAAPELTDNLHEVGVLKQQVARAAADKKQAQTERDTVVKNYNTAVEAALAQERSRLELLHKSRLEALQGELAKEKRLLRETQDKLQSALTTADEISKGQADQLSLVQEKLDTANNELGLLQQHKNTLDQHLRQARVDARKFKASQLEALAQVELFKHAAGQSLGKEHFEKKYTEMRNLIERWAVEYFGGKIELTESPTKSLRNLAEDHNDYLDDPGMRPRLVQAFIWSILTDLVFNHSDRNCSGLWWARPCRKELAALRAFLMPYASDVYESEQDLERAKKEYNHFRATTAKLIRSKNKAPNREARRVPEAPINAALDRLENFCNENANQNRTQLLRELDHIFKLAVDLDEDMNMEAAYYLLDMPRFNNNPNCRYGFEFDPNTMSIDPIITSWGADAHSRIVGLVITPTLYVQGDAHGEGLLEDPVPLLKSIVMPQFALMKKPREFNILKSKDERKGAESQKQKGWTHRLQKGDKYHGGS